MRSPAEWGQGGRHQGAPVATPRGLGRVSGKGMLWRSSASPQVEHGAGALGNSDHGPFTSGQGRVTGDQIRTLTGNHLKLEHRHGIRVGRSEPRLSPRGSGRARRREHGLSGARMEEMHRASGEAKAAEPRRKELH